MSNEELKKKICDIIAPYVSAYGDDERIADALIAAGIGDVKRHRVFVSKDGKEVKQFYSGEEVENIVKERNELKVELRDKVDYIHEQDEVIKEYKHRAEVAEKALKIVAYEIPCDDWCPFSQKCNVELNGENWYQCCFDEYLRQAEKELAEEKNDD